MSGVRRRPMRRLGDLLPEAAAALGFEEELRLARAMAAWDRVVAEHVPRAAGASHLIGLRGDALLVTAGSSAVATELQLHSAVLLAAVATAPGGVRARELRIAVRAAGVDRRSGPAV